MFNIHTLFRKPLKLDKRNHNEKSILGFNNFLHPEWFMDWQYQYEKYDKYTISTSGEYNQALVGPEYKVNALDYGISPIYSVGIDNTSKRYNKYMGRFFLF